MEEDPRIYDTKLDELVGRTIAAVEDPDDEDGLIVTCTDGTRWRFEGHGYDGLWKDVSLFREKPRRALEEVR